jgi:hypothetical protein
MSLIIMHISTMRSPKVLSRELLIMAMMVSMLAINTVNVAGDVTAVRVPDGGIQPQVVTDKNDVIHLIYYKGDHKAGEIYYVKSKDAKKFSKPIRVNSQKGSAVAIGNIRGAQLAVGKAGRIHVTWNGSQSAQPKTKGGHTPMLYARLNDASDAFEPQRNVLVNSWGLDGGGSIAADQEGKIWITWHGAAQGQSHAEANRQIWITLSEDEGKTFVLDKPVSNQKGVCACCGMRSYSDGSGRLYILYRAALNGQNRDMALMLSKDGGRKFTGQILDRWQVNSCPMSSAHINADGKQVLLAWETAGSVKLGIADASSGRLSKTIVPKGPGKNRKHPVIAVNKNGRILLAWTEGLGWSRGGSTAWQVFDKSGKLIKGMSGRSSGVPKWSLVAAAARSDGSFVVFY